MFIWSACIFTLVNIIQKYFNHTAMMLRSCVPVPFFNGKLYEIVSPERFLQILKTNKDAIKRSEFLPPRLGSNSLGRVYIEYYYVPKSKS